MEFVDRRGDVAGPVGIGPREVVCRILLVCVEEALQLDAVAAYVSQVDNDILSELALQIEVPVLDVAVFGVLGNVGDVVSSGVEGGDQSGGITLLGCGIAAW